VIEKLNWRGPPKYLEVSSASQYYTEAPSGLSSEMSTTPTARTELTARPKRADARRNYDALIKAAREAFTEADRSASLEDIARRAGVGIGTLYRHFPTRADLIEAVYVEEVEGLARSAENRADESPWNALVDWLHGFVGYIATKQALADELFAVAEHNMEVFANCRAALDTAGEPLLRRAQAAGEVRKDVQIREVVRMVAAIAKMPSDEPGEIDRVLDVALDGLRAR
jgi:AcrR family transcriptional regulator